MSQDGRQKGEVQLAFTFHPFGQSPHGSQHGPSTSDEAASEATPPVSPQVSPHRPGHRAEVQGTGLKAEGSPQPAPQSLAVDESLGPLGQSFMNLAMSHISPNNANSSSRSLDNHAYLQLGTRPEGIHESPSALTGQTSSPAPGQPSTSSVTASPQRRNFYPEEASDDESDMPSQHSRRTSAAGDSESALPAEFRCPQPSNNNTASGADDTVDQASYSSQEVYHAYCTRGFSGRQTNAQLPSPQYGAYMADASPSGQGHEQQPQVPAWRLLGTSPLRDGQMQHLEQPQAQQVLAGQQQPSRQSYSQPSSCPGQGNIQQALGQGHQSLPPRPEWHLMGGPSVQSGPMVGDYTPGSTSLSFTVQGRGPSYASLAVGSWTDGVNQSRAFARQGVSQVRSGCMALYRQKDVGCCICNACFECSAQVAMVHYQLFFT